MKNTSLWHSGNYRCIIAHIFASVLSWLWKRTGPGGPPGLQIRRGVRRASLVGSIPMRFRHDFIRFFNFALITIHWH